MSPRQRWAFFAWFVSLGIAPTAPGQWQHLGEVTEVRESPHAIELACGEAVLRVQAMDEGIVRIRLAPDGNFGRDFSWAVVDLTSHGSITNVEKDDDAVAFKAGGLTVEASRAPCRLTIRDADGNVILREDPTRGIGWRPGRSIAGIKDRTVVHTWHEMPDGTAVFGLGEKSGPLNKAEQAVTMWNTDAWSYGPATDPLYKSIPFFIAGRDGRHHGVFFDNPWRSSFDFGKADRNILSFGAEGGEMNYYVIAGPQPADVLRRYTALTGRIELPPRWTIGYHQCRFSYYPDERVRELAMAFRKKRIPCDVIYFDIDYMDDFRCFTWDPEFFPDPKGLNDFLHEAGFHTIAIIDPGIKHEPGYSVYDSGTEHDVWLKTRAGKPYVGRVWPGDTVFPDYTNPQVRDWWAELFPPFLESCGIDGVWNDMNEPANFAGPNKTVPLDLVHDNEGEPAPHLACHNVYGTQMARATLAGLKKARPNQRVFTMTRAMYAGAQRYAAAWTGDNVSTWEHLRLSLRMVLNMGVSGMPFVGPDIGGFAVGATPELYARWIQLGSFFPYCRTHTAKYNPPQEPWSYGERVEAIARASLELRYSLLPYHYTLFEEAARTGAPIMRPLWYEGVSRDRWANELSFMLGPHLLVAPIMKPDAGHQVVWMPDGVWFDYHTGHMLAAGHPLRSDGALESLPIFVHAGAIIPRQTPTLSTTLEPKDPLILDVWPRGTSEYTFYEDDGTSLEFLRGGFRRTTCRAVRDGERVEVGLVGFEGDFEPPDRKPLIRVHGIFDEVARVSFVLDEGAEPRAGVPIVRADAVTERASWHHDPVTGVLTARLDSDRGQPQRMTVELQPRRIAEPVVFTFDDLATGADHVSEMDPARYAGGAIHLKPGSSWGPRVTLPPTWFRARDLPLLKVRISTESTRQLRVRIATTAEPHKLNDVAGTLALTPDGAYHEYTAVLNAWPALNADDPVCRIQLELGEGVRKNEHIRIDEVRFDPAVE